MNGYNLVSIGISFAGRGTLRYAALISAVHHISPMAIAICIMNAKVSDLTVGLNV